MTVRQVGWMVHCPATRGRAFEYSKHRAQEVGEELYAPKPFVVVPLYVSDDGTNYIFIDDGKTDGAVEQTVTEP